MSRDPFPIWFTLGVLSLVYFTITGSLGTPESKPDELVVESFDGGLTGGGTIHLGDSPERRLVEETVVLDSLGELSFVDSSGNIHVIATRAKRFQFIYRGTPTVTRGIWGDHHD